MLTVKIEAVGYMQFDRRKVRSAMGKASRILAQQLKKTAGQRSGQGRMYQTKTGAHRASAPGQPPVRYTSNLWRSIKGRASRRGYAIVVSAIAPHANLVEMGSRNAAERPYFAPTFTDARDTVQDLLREAVNAGITVHVGQPGNAPKRVEIN